MIIQTSPQHTGSTLLVNALYGLIPQLADKRILGCWTKKLDPLDITVLKYHNINIDELSKKYKIMIYTLFALNDLKRVYL